MKSEAESQAEKQEKISMTFDRNVGFVNNKWKVAKKSFTTNGYKLIKKYTKRIENELDFRFITTKKIEIVILVVLSISALLLFLLQSKESGLLFIAILVFLIYLLSIIKAFKLNVLIKKFNSTVNGLDEKYFGVRITNTFGRRKPWFYALVPFIKPDIEINIEASKLVSSSSS